MAHIKASDVPFGAVFIVRDVLDGEIRNSYYVRVNTDDRCHRWQCGDR